MIKPDDSRSSDINAVALVELAAVKGQLTAMTQMLMLNHQATDKRIDDLRHAVENRFSGVEGRVHTLESNERSTAIKTAGLGAFAGALVSAAIAAASGGRHP